MSEMYQALYRKWRPMVFEDVVGQSHISETLRNSIKTGRIAHAYLFCGTRGTGKTTCAKIFSRAVNCENPQDGNPCNTCPSCLGIMDGSIMDVFEMDAASNRGVGDIKQIRDEVDYAPSNCKYKVYIIDEAHMITNEGFNALLKTLEEPPEYVIFILATTEPNKILPTILSRCQRFDFRRIGVDDISSRINKICSAENIALTPDASELIAELADGSMRDGLSILEQCTASKTDEIRKSDVSEIVGIVDGEVLFELADFIADGDTLSCLKTADSFLNRGKEVTSFFEDIIEHFRNLMFCKATKTPEEIIERSHEKIEKYKIQAEKYTVERLLYSITTLCEYLSQAKWIASPKISVEMALLKLANPKYGDNNDAILSRLAELETKLASGSFTASPSIKKAEAKPKDTKKAEAKPEKKTVSSNSTESREWDKWGEALSIVKNESKKLYMFLFRAKAYETGDAIEIVLSNKEAYERISTPQGKEYLSGLFEKISGESRRVIVSEEGNRLAAPVATQGASIADLMKKKDLLGDTMTIIGENNL